MVKELSFVDLPSELYGIIEIASKKQEPEKPEGYNVIKFNKKNHIEEFNRLVDPVIISMFYGLYISKKLPDTKEPISLDYKREFNVNISSYWEIFSHLLFCLWIKINGYPNESTNVLEYRNALYQFIKELLDEDHCVNTIIPFYLNEACKSDTLFLHNLKESGFIEFKSTVNSPEYLALEFQTVQKDFEDEIIRPLFDKITPASDVINIESFEGDFRKFLNKGENQYVEFKSSALWSKNYSDEDIKNSGKPDLINYGKNASKFIIAKAIASFLNSNGGNLIIGIEDEKDYKIIGIDDEFLKLKDQNDDGYRRMINDEIIRNYFESNIYNNIGKYIKFTFHIIDKKTLCWIQIQKSDIRVFIKNKNNKYDLFFIRTDAETREISGKDLVDYCKERFK